MSTPINPSPWYFCLVSTSFLKMFPRRSNQVHPQSSERSLSLLPVVTPPTSSKDAVDYSSLKSPLTLCDAVEKLSNEENSQRRFRWFYNYPRLTFVLLFVLGSYVSGIYVSTKVTSWTLDVLGVHDELAAAREVYLSTSQMLNSMSNCVEQNSLQYLAAAKMKFEADNKHVQKVIDANDKMLDSQENATMTCSKAFLANLQSQVQTAAPTDTNTTLSCFSDAFYADISETKTLSSSRALVLAVRTILTSQAVTEARDHVDNQQKQFETQLLDMWGAVDAVKLSIQNTMNATNALTTKDLDSFAPLWSDNDGSGHDEQSASRLGRLSKIAASKLHDPLVNSVSATSLEVIRKAGRTLRKALEFLSGLHEGFSDILNALEEAWEMLENQFNATVKQAMQLQKELVYAAESTASQINRTRTSITTSLDQAQQEVSSSFDVLQQQWKTSIQKFVDQGFAPWRRLGSQLVAELTENQRQTVRPANSIQRKYILPDRTSNSSLGQQHDRLTTLRNDTPPAPSKDEGFHIDTAVLRASLIDVGVVVTNVIFFVDVGRLTLLFADLAVDLITESYSDMPMLDIRGVTTEDTIGSVCEVLLCKHSFSVVCFTLVAKSSELLRSLVSFLLLLVAAIIVTALLYTWKQDHISTCGNSNASGPLSTVQSIARGFIENSGNSNESVVDPLNEVEKYAGIINDSVRNDYTVLAVDSSAVWMNQSTLLTDLENCVTTTSGLVRMLQTCSEGVPEYTSLSNRCLPSNVPSTTGLEDPSPLVSQLNTNAPFLAASSAFEECFPQLEVGREEGVNKLQHRLTCATEKAVYLSCASWWLLLVVFFANRFVVRMLIKSAGIYWWRFLSADRLQVTAFCKEDGSIQASDQLPSAIQQHLDQVKWRIASRIIGVGLAFVWVVTAVVVLFDGV